jgi:hypothetical protein
MVGLGRPDDFILDRQVDIALCWAATVVAVQKYHGVNSQDQYGLSQSYGNKPNRPQKVLVEKGFSTNVLGDYVNKPRQIDIKLIQEDVGHNLTFNLPHGPVLASLTTADDSRWETTDGRSYLFHHAVLITKYQERGSNGNPSLIYADPAAPSGLSEREIDVADFVNEFVYLQNLGPIAAAKFAVNPGVVKTRLRMLIAFAPPPI